MNINIYSQKIFTLNELKSCHFIHQIITLYLHQLKLQSCRCLSMIHKITTQQLRQQIYFLISSIKDPQKISQTLQDLQVVSEDRIQINTITAVNLKFNQQVLAVEQNKKLNQMQWQSCEYVPNGKFEQFPKLESEYYKEIIIRLKPTVPHCHLMQQIALAIRYRLKLQLPDYQTYKIKLICVDGSHLEAEAINKQINDKQRVIAALQNQQITQFLDSLVKWN